MDSEFAVKSWNDAIAWLISISPDPLDPYIEAIAAFILIISGVFAILWPLISFVIKLIELYSEWRKKRIRDALRSSIFDGIKKGGRPQDVVAEEIRSRDIDPKSIEGRELGRLLLDFISGAADPDAPMSEQPKEAPTEEDERSAARDAEIAIVEFSKHADDLAQQALGALYERQYDRAAELILTAANNHPEDAPRRLRRFGTFASAIDHELAQKVFRVAAELDPEDAGTFNLLAISLRAKARKTKTKAEKDELMRAASNAFQKTVELAHGSNQALEAQALTDLGRIQRSLGQFDAALTSQKRALELKRYLPKGSKAFTNHHEIGLIAMREGHFSRAKYHIGIAARQAKRLGRSLEHDRNRSILGVIERRLGNLISAEKIHKETLQSPSGKAGGPQRPSELTNLGIVYRMRGQFEKAKACHEEVLGLGGNESSEAISLIALLDLALEQGEVQQAEAMLSELSRKADPANRRTAQSIREREGVLARLSGDPARAERIHRDSLDQNPDFDALVLLNLSWALAEQGKNEEMLRFITKARKAFEDRGQDFETAECREVQALSLLKVDRRGEASSHLKSANRLYKECGADFRAGRATKLRRELVA